MAEKRITKKERDELQRLYENSKSGKDDDIDALYIYADEIGVEPDEIAEYVAVKAEPETEQEKRQSMKGRAADERRESEAIDIDAIAKAYGVDLEEAQDEGELVKGDLQNYLNSRFVARPSPNETRDEYEQRNINAFEALGLNWFNKDDRARVFKSMEAANLLDAREGLSEEWTSGPMGLLRQLVAPRQTEHAVRDILEGERTGSYLKDYLLDWGENALQSINAPVSAVGKGMKVARGVKAAQKAASTAKKAGEAMTMAERAEKAGKAAGTLAEMAGNASAVPLLMEIADAAAYDGEESPRGEFSVEDVLVGAGTNLATPLVLSKVGTRGTRALGDDATKAAQAIEDIKEAVNFKRLADYAVPYGVNKLGRSEYTSYIPGIGSISKEREKETERREKKDRTLREKESKWSRGLSIPMPGDRDYEDYKKFKERVSERMMLRDYVE
jgi:hypothetical protein